MGISESVWYKMYFYRRREQLQEARKRDAQENNDLEEVDRDISVLEAELKYKMSLREKALDKKRKEIDDEIETKILERDELLQERKLLTRQSPESRLQGERGRVRQRSSSGERRYERESRPWADRSYGRSPSADRALSRERQSVYDERHCSLDRARGHDYSERPCSRERAGRRSRSRSLSPVYNRERITRRPLSRSLSPSRRNRSVDFDESLNSLHSYRYHSPRDFLDSGYCEGDEGSRDSATNTPIIRNGRVLKLKPTKEERPPWKYWKADGAPDVIGPPWHEPYNQGAVAEPLELRDTKVRNGGK